MSQHFVNRLVKSYEAAIDLLLEVYIDKDVKDVEDLIQERMNQIANRKQWDREVEKIEHNIDLYEPLN